MISVEDISNRLSDRVDEVCQLLLPGGRQESGQWVSGDVGGGEGKSLKVHLTGSHAGRWKDWSNDDDKGDLIDLWRSSKGISLPDAIKEIKEYLGIRDSQTIVNDKRWSKPSANGVATLAPEGAAIKYLREQRLLDPAIINRFEIKGDPKNKAIVFPCYSPSGELINRSYRTLDAEKKVWQDKGCAPCLFGWNALDESAYQKRTILLCEGQIDCMTWAQWGIPALSIPNGSGRSWIEYEWDNLAAFDHIYLAFDGDEAGQKNLQETIQRLGKHRCLLVSIPEKDANDALKAGRGPMEAQEWVHKAKLPSIAGMVKASDMKERIQEQIRIKPPVYTLEFLKGHTSNHGYYPRPGEITLWTGHTSQGKSTILNTFILAYLMNEKPCFVASMEMLPEVLIQQIMTTGFATSGLLQKHVDSFMEEMAPHLVFADVIGYIEPGALLEMMWFSYQRFGIKEHFIDSIMRVAGLEEDFPKQGEFLNKLQQFAKTTGSHVHLVAHPRKPSKSGDRARALDVKGSSLIPNNVDNILAIARNFDKDELRKDRKLTAQEEAEMYDACIDVEKQRATGWQGRFLLKFNRDTLQFTKFK